MQSIMLIPFVLVSSFSLCGAVRFEDSRMELFKQAMDNAGSKESHDAIMRKMTLASAVEHLRTRNSTINLATRSRFLGKTDKDAAAMVAKWAQPAGVAGAKLILTEIIEDTMSKLDAEQNRCNDYDINQRAIIRGTKDDISNFNAISAEAREEILDAQSKIDEAERELPQLAKVLKKVEATCAEDISIIKEQLRLALADLNVMDMILNNTNCKTADMTFPSAFLQCVNTSTGEAFVTFRDSRTRSRVAQLQHKPARQAILKSFDAFAQVEMGEAPYEVKDGMRCYCANEKPACATSRGGGKCFDMEGGDGCAPQGRGFWGNGCPPPEMPKPANKEKAQSKCAFSNQQNCFLLREKLLSIQGNLAEKVDQLRIVLNHKQTTCEAQIAQYEREISNFKRQLGEAQTALAAATKKQNDADAGSRLKNEQLIEQTNEHIRETKKCKLNIEAFMGDICAVEKIRVQVELLQSGAIDPKYQVIDCAVSKWQHEACSVSCGGGGFQTSFRKVLIPAKNGGAHCPSLARTQPCGNDPCPVNCQQSEWSEWSTCSAECNGGVRTRSRVTEVEAENGGNPCGETQKIDACGIGSCDADCDLAQWSDWSTCSKMCNGGSQERRRHIDTPAKGEGKCASENDASRFNVRPCNPQLCVPAPNGPGYLQCNNTKLDVILVMDASGSLRQQGWDATVHWAKRLVKAFEPSDTRIALMTFSGARSYWVTRECAENPSDYSPEACGIVWLKHFTNASDGQNELQTAIDNAVWTRSFTLMSLALSAAEAELSLGRKDANSIVITITDGRPMSKDRTKMAAKSIREKSRLMFVPVTSYAPIADIRSWASNPVRENVIQVMNWDTLELPQTVSEVVANACPNVV